jgi:threonyl-tRNA synthetase
MQKIPYLLVVGQKEVESGAVAVRARGNKDLGSMPVEKFIELIKEDVKNKR